MSYIVIKEDEVVETHVFIYFPEGSSNGLFKVVIPSEDLLFNEKKVKIASRFEKIDRGVGDDVFDDYSVVELRAD